jgi:hypothetical protein
MKIKPDRAPVFLQLLAHRERWRRLGEGFAFRNQDLSELSVSRKDVRLFGRERERRKFSLL